MMDRAALYGILFCVTLANGSGAVAEKSLSLQLPIKCDLGRSCFIQNFVDHDTSDGAIDYMCGKLTYDGHKGTDFRVPDVPSAKSVEVLAAASGRVLRIRDGMPDRSFRDAPQQDIAGKQCGNAVVIGHGSGWETQYCHLARGSVGVRPGDLVMAGQPIGAVGLSGLTEFPHLHFSVSQHGRVIDPFAGQGSQEQCGTGNQMWRADLESELEYSPTFILNQGFASSKISMREIEAGVLGDFALGEGTPALVAVVRAGGLLKGDVLEFSLHAPNGEPLASKRASVARDFAQHMTLIGRRRPELGWNHGTYRATYRVVRDGALAASTEFATSY